MAESSADGIQIRSDRNRFLALFRDFLPPSFGLNHNIRDKLRARFGFSSARETREQASNHAYFYDDYHSRNHPALLREIHIMSTGTSSHSSVSIRWAMSNSLLSHNAHIQSYSQTSAALNSILPGHDAVAINIPMDVVYDGFIGGHRATRDDEAAGHSELFNALFPANLTIAYEAFSIFESKHNSAQPLSSKTFGYLTVGFVGAAVFSSLAGLSLSTFKPNTLPFGCTRQRMMQIMHNVGVHTTAYAFIGTMCHQFLQDDPSIMWTVAGLASAAFMGLMICIGRRR